MVSPPSSQAVVVAHTMEEAEDVLFGSGETQAKQGKARESLQSSSVLAHMSFPKRAHSSPRQLEMKGVEEEEERREEEREDEEDEEDAEDAEDVEEEEGGGTEEEERLLPREEEEDEGLQVASGVQAPPLKEQGPRPVHS